MGIRDLFSGGGKGKKSGGGGMTESFAEFDGMRVEVMGEDGSFLFVARLAATMGGKVRLEQMSDVPAAPAAEEEETFPAELRGYHEGQKKAVHMSCVLTREGNGSWAAEGLKITGKDNDRAFFRQAIEIAGEVVPVGKPGVSSAPCLVINISAGGACIRTGASFSEGDKVLLRAQILPGKAPLLCGVHRITETNKGLFEYGCEFLDLNSSTEDQLARAIAEMQMKRMKR